MTNFVQLQPRERPYYFMHLCNACYKDDPSGYLANLHLPTEVKDSAEFSGWKVVLFQHRNTNDLVVGFRGTKVLSNWRDDIMHQLNRIPVASLEINCKLREWKKKYGKISVLTGHSAGGFFATYILRKWKQVLRITFNGHLCEKAPHCINLRTPMDPLSFFGGADNYVTVGNGDAGHSLADFFPFLTGGVSWTDLVARNVEWVEPHKMDTVKTLRDQLESVKQSYQTALRMLTEDLAEAERRGDWEKLKGQVCLHSESLTGEWLQSKMALAFFLRRGDEQVAYFHRLSTVQALDDETYNSQVGCLELFLKDVGTFVDTLFQKDFENLSFIPPKLMSRKFFRFSQYFLDQAQLNECKDFPNAYLFFALVDHLCNKTVQPLLFQKRGELNLKDFKVCVTKLIQGGETLERLYGALSSLVKRAESTQQTFCEAQEAAEARSGVLWQQRDGAIAQHIAQRASTEFQKLVGEDFVGSQKFLFSYLVHSPLLADARGQVNFEEIIEKGFKVHMESSPEEALAVVSGALATGATLGGPLGAGIGFLGGFWMLGVDGSHQEAKVNEAKGDIQTFSQELSEIENSTKVHYDSRAFRLGQHKAQQSLFKYRNFEVILEHFFSNALQRSCCKVKIFVWNVDFSLKPKRTVVTVHDPLNLNKRHLLEIKVVGRILTDHQLKITRYIPRDSAITERDLMRIPPPPQGEDSQAIIDRSLKNLLQDLRGALVGNPEGPLAEENIFRRIVEGSKSVDSLNPKMIPLFYPNEFLIHWKGKIQDFIQRVERLEAGTVHPFYDLRYDPTKCEYNLVLCFYFWDAEEEDFRKAKEAFKVCSATFDSKTVDCWRKFSFKDWDYTWEPPNLNELLVETFYCCLGGVAGDRVRDVMGIPGGNTYRTEEGFIAPEFQSDFIGLHRYMKLAPDQKVLFGGTEDEDYSLTPACIEKGKDFELVEETLQLKAKQKSRTWPEFQAHEKQYQTALVFAMGVGGVNKSCAEAQLRRLSRGGLFTAKQMLASSKINLAPDFNEASTSQVFSNKAKQDVQKHLQKLREFSKGLFGEEIG